MLTDKQTELTKLKVSLQSMSMETLVCESYFSLASLQRMSMATLFVNPISFLLVYRECPWKL